MINSYVNGSIRCKFNAPENTFMIDEISPSYLKNKPGIIIYHKEFKAV